MTNAIIEKAKERFAHSHESLAREFGSICAGRANASLLDRITVEYYGAPTPLNQLASITVPEARVLLISPFDKGSIADIERAINESDLGINPANDGSVVRLVIPALTEETRKELAKEVKKVGENAKIAIRNIRRDAMDEAKKQEKDKEITEDQLKASEKDIQKATDDAVKQGVHAGNIIKACAAMVGGGGGGRPNMAQAGGKNPAGIDAALEEAKKTLEQQL